MSRVTVLQCFFSVSSVNREAVRQRKALSRTSSNILLNSVHLQNQSYNYQPSNINNRTKVQNTRSSDCDEPNLVIKESHHESHSEISDLEVRLINRCNYWFPIFWRELILFLLKTFRYLKAFNNP